MVQIEKIKQKLGDSYGPLVQASNDNVIDACISGWYSYPAVKQTASKM